MQGNQAVVGMSPDESPQTREGVMTIGRAAIAAAAGALALGVVSPVMAPPGQARQIKTLKLELARANKTISARNKTIAADNVTIKALRSVVLLPTTGGVTSLANLTPALAWPLVAALFPIFPANANSPTCGTTYEGTVNTSSSNFSGWGYTSTDYDFNQTDNFAPAGYC